MEYIFDQSLDIQKEIQNARNVSDVQMFRS